MFRSVALLFYVAALPAAADDAPIPMTYEMFENAVAHTDLMSCPDGLAARGRFCRVVLHNHELQVFAFAEDGDQPLVGYATWPDDRLARLFDRRLD